MNDPQRVAVVGATGYAGFELAQLLLRHPKIQKPTFYSAREFGAREVPHRNLPASARLGRSALQDVFGRCRSRERSGHRVSRDAARSFAGNGAATLERGPARCGPERRVPLPRSGNVRALVQIAGAAEESGGRGRVRLAGACMPINCRTRASSPIPAATRRA